MGQTLGHGTDRKDIEGLVFLWLINDGLGVIDDPKTMDDTFEPQQVYKVS